MAKLLKLRRGTTSQHSSFTGAEGEVTVDTDKETLVVHDGSTAGGFPVARADNPDSQKVRFGTGNDLEIFHDGSNSWVSNTTGDLNLKSTGDDVVITAADDVQILLESSENGILAKSAGAVEIYYDGAKKFETNSVGAQWFGDLKGNDNQVFKVGTGNDLQIYHDGTDSFINNNTGALKVGASTGGIELNTADGHAGIHIHDDGNVELYYNNAKKLETMSNGVTITGNCWADAFYLGDSEKSYWGTGDDLQIYHDGSNSYISDTGTGDLILKGGQLKIESSNSTETKALFTNDGAAEIYYDGSKKFETYSAGTLTTGNCKATGDFRIENDTGKIELGASGDLQIYHDGSNSYIQDDGTGELRLRGTNIRLSDNDGSETFGVFNDNGTVELYCDNVKKFETHSDGIQVLGAEGADGVIYLMADEADDAADQWKLNAAAAGGFFLENKTSGSWETNIKAEGNGGVSLYYDNTLTCYTSNGCLSFPDSQKIFMGAGNDLQLYHDATHSWIVNNTGTLVVEADQIDIRAVNNEHYIEAVKDGGVSLYYDNSEKVRITSTGFKTLGNAQFDDDRKVEFGDGQDLQIYHDGSNSHIHQDGTGDLQIRSDNSVEINTNGTENAIWCDANGAVKLYHDNSLKFKTTSDGVIVDGGIYLDGSGGGNAANKMDDYEEGTWTPDPHDGTCSNTASNYTKIGRQVTCWTFLSSFSDTSTNDQIKIKDLPFAPANDMVAGNALCSYSNDVSCVHAFVDTSSRITFFGNNSGSFSQYRHNEMNNANAQIKLVVTYYTA